MNITSKTKTGISSVIALIEASVAALCIGLQS